VQARHVNRYAKQVRGRGDVPPAVELREAAAA
jgi:hypothetical protein